MEKILNEQIIGQIKEAFAGLNHPVQILYFGSAENCEYCSETQQLLSEIGEVDERLSLSIYDLKKDAGIATQYNVDKAPVIVIASKKGEQVIDLGVQFSGIPSGYEFSTLINDIVFASQQDSGLGAASREYLKSLTQPLLLQVFVTPTCPHCPRAAQLAHQIAMENPKMIRAEAVDAMEFPELAQRFNVQGVPQTVINSGSGILVGAYPEQRLLDEIRSAIKN